MQTMSGTEVPRREKEGEKTVGMLKLERAKEEVSSKKSWALITMSRHCKDRE